ICRAAAARCSRAPEQQRSNLDVGVDSRGCRRTRILCGVSVARASDTQEVRRAADLLARWRREAVGAFTPGRPYQRDFSHCDVRLARAHLYLAQRDRRCIEARLQCRGVGIELLLQVTLP